MAHHSRLDKVVIDVAPADHDKEVAFWSGATGQPMTQGRRHPEYHWAEIPGQDVGLLIQRLDEGASRVHVDIHTTDVAAEVARLEQLGSDPNPGGQRLVDHAGPGGLVVLRHPGWHRAAHRRQRSTLGVTRCSPDGSRQAAPSRAGTKARRWPGADP